MCIYVYKVHLYVLKMISDSMSPQRMAEARITPTESPTELPVVIIPACASACSSIEAEANMFVRPMNEKMDRLFDAISMPLSPDCWKIHARQQAKCIRSKTTKSPITELQQKRLALLFDWK